MVKIRLGVWPGRSCEKKLPGQDNKEVTKA